MLHSSHTIALNKRTIFDTKCWFFPKDADISKIKMFRVLKLMCVYIPTKFQVSSIITTSFRREVILPTPPLPTKGTPKNPTQIKVNLKSIPSRYSPCFKHNLFVHKTVSWWPTSRINMLTIYYQLGQDFITNWGSFALLQIGAA